jgi:hypothetical protein
MFARRSRHEIERVWIVAGKQLSFYPSTVLIGSDFGSAFSGEHPSPSSVFLQILPTHGLFPAHRLSPKLPKFT